MLLKIPKKCQPLTTVSGKNRTPTDPDGSQKISHIFNYNIETYYF